MSNAIVWTKSPSDLAAELETVYHDKVLAAVGVLITLFAAKVEAYAKNYAPWTDRTGNARQTLFTVTELAQDTMALYLSHGVSYGVWLELLHQGRYAIVLPALQAHYQEFIDAVRGMLA